MSEKENDPSSLMAEASISVTFAGIMAAATFFAIPILLGAYRNSLSSALFYLIMSMFGYINSVLIYANASGEFRLRSAAGIRKGNRIMEVGNIVSEYFGVYYTAMAFPLVFLAFTGVALATLTFIVVIGGVVFYHSYQVEGAGFSILERYTSTPEAGKHPKRLFNAVVLFLLVLISINYASNVIFAGYIFNPITTLTTAAVVIFTLLLARHSLRRGEGRGPRFAAAPTGVADESTVKMILSG